MNVTASRYAHAFSALTRLEKEPVGQQQPADHLRIVLGVYTNTDPWSARALRDNHRSTWIRASRIMCPPRAPPFANGCSMLVRFVLVEHHGSKELLAAEEAAHGDFLWIRSKTLYLQDKLSLWIFAALKIYPSLTHMAKVDADTYVSPRRLLSAIAASNATADPNLLTLAGFLIAGADHVCGVPKRKPRCQWHCPPSNCTRADGFERAGCWLYAQGGFYLFSRAIAQQLAAHLKGEQSHARCVEYQWEDANLGRLIGMIAHTRAARDFSHPNSAGRVHALDLKGSPAACGRVLQKPLVFYHLYGSYFSRGRLSPDCTCTVFDRARKRCRLVTQVERSSRSLLLNTSQVGYHAPG